MEAKVSENLDENISIQNQNTEIENTEIEKIEKTEEKDSELSLSQEEDEGSLIIEGADLDTCLQGGFKSNCLVCKHPASKEAVYVYFNSDKNYDNVRKWFHQKYQIDFLLKQIETHFKNHVSPYINKDIVLRDQRHVLLLRKASEKPTVDKLAVIREMHWEYMNQIYEYIPTDLKDPKSKEEHRKATKQFTELVKSYTETCKTEWEMLGQGKTEEEQKEIVKNYVKNTIQKSLDIIKSEHPEAYKKLAEKMGIEAPTFIRDESLDKDDDMKSILDES